MPAAYSDSTIDWVPAIRQRRRALLQRLGLGAATAMIFSPLFGGAVTGLWLGGYFVIQLLDLLIFGPINSGRNEPMGRIRSMAGCLILFLNAAAFGSLSIPLWLTGGPMGGICAAILLASGAIYAIVNSPRSTRVLVISLTPHLLYMALIPFFMAAHGAGSSFITAVSIAILVFAAYCVHTWQSITQAYGAENTARVEADRKRDEAESAMTSRSAFLAAVGHDLRTPITAILTGAAEMERAAGDASARSNAALITDAGLMMKAMLDDLLDHSRLNAGRMTVEAADFDLRGLMAQTVRLWNGPIRAKGLTLRIDGARTLPGLVRGDAMRVRQVLNNLLSNALKFTDAGSITLSVKSWVEEPSGHAILIEVADTGPGMTADQLGRLFNPFDQTAAGVSARHGGTGLGLSISRDLVELMGGRLTARSTPGDGARFTFSVILGHAITTDAPVATFAEGRGDVSRALAHATTLRAQPAAAAPAPAPPKSETPSSAPAGDEDLDRPMRVLVVDDHDINRRAIELILAPLGCDIATAADGLAALRLCDDSDFDVIFMDVRMPELDGRETTRRLRAGTSPNAHVPVIAVTADTAPDDIAACMAAGMTYFVSKPLTPTTLLGALSHVMSGADAQAESAAA